jgi:hypothetical protein
VYLDCLIGTATVLSLETCEDARQRGTPACIAIRSRGRRQLCETRISKRLEGWSGKLYATSIRIVAVGRVEEHSSEPYHDGGSHSDVDSHLPAHRVLASIRLSIIDSPQAVLAQDFRGVAPDVTGQYTTGIHSQRSHDALPAAARVAGSASALSEMSHDVLRLIREAHCCRVLRRVPSSVPRARMRRRLVGTN